MLTEIGKQKKKFRSLWIQINAGVELKGLRMLNL